MCDIICLDRLLLMSGDMLILQTIENIYFINQ